MRVTPHGALKACSLVLLALCGCATAKEEAVFEGSSPGTYWELVGWEDHEITGSWDPATIPGYEARDQAVVYVNQFRRRGWGTAAPWSWFSNGECFLYEVQAWRELRSSSSPDAVPARETRQHSAHYRETFIPRFLEQPLEYLAETDDPEAADDPQADAADIERAREVVPRGLVDAGERA